MKKTYRTPIWCNGTYYISASAAARHLGVSPSGIIKCCKGKQDSYKGLVFRYADETPNWINY